jgi:hypothetical protein
MAADSHSPGSNRSPLPQPVDSFERRVHLLPRDKAHGWAPYIWLV